MHLIYYCYGALMEKERRHPQEVLKSIGINYQCSTPQSMSDSWWFWNCENIPEKMPSFIRELKEDPMDCIGWGLSQEKAEKIRDYNT
jgi:hypothetical protein